MSFNDIPVLSKFKLEEAVIIDDRFIVATIAVIADAETESLIVEVEMSGANMPPHIEDAKWLESQDSALAFVGEHLAEVQNILAEIPLEETVNHDW